MVINFTYKSVTPYIIFIRRFKHGYEHMVTGRKLWMEDCWPHLLSWYTSFFVKQLATLVTYCILDLTTAWFSSFISNSSWYSVSFVVEVLYLHSVC